VTQNALYLPRCLCRSHLLVVNLADRIFLKPPFSLRFAACEHCTGRNCDDGHSLRQDTCACSATDHRGGSDRVRRGCGHCRGHAHCGHAAASPTSRRAARSNSGRLVHARPRIIFCESILSPWYMAITPRHSTPAVAKQPSGTSGFRPPNMFCSTTNRRQGGETAMQVAAPAPLSRVTRSAHHTAHTNRMRTQPARRTSLSPPFRITAAFAPRPPSGCAYRPARCKRGGQPMATRNVDRRGNITQRTDRLRKPLVHPVELSLLSARRARGRLAQRDARLPHARHPAPAALERPNRAASTWRHRAQQPQSTAPTRSYSITPPSPPRHQPLRPAPSLPAASNHSV
jgi:hypothetical protein